MKEKSTRILFPATVCALKVLGKEVREARKKRGYSQNELAQRARCSRDTIAAIESGKTTVEIGLFFDVAARVGLIVFGQADELHLRRIRIQDLLTKKQ